MNEATSTLSKVMITMRAGQRVRPADATTIYLVKWYLKSDDFDTFGARISSSPTPVRLERSRAFVSKDKAQELLNQLNTAFQTLEYGLEGLAFIEEDWYE